MCMGNLVLLNGGLAKLRRIAIAGTLLGLSACSPIGFWRQPEQANFQTPTLAVGCLQAPGPQPQEDSPLPAHASEIAPTVAEGIARQERTATPDVEPPPLLPMPVQRSQLMPPPLPRELCTEAEPAPAPRCINCNTPASEPALVAALRAYLLGETESAVEHLRGYEERDQQFLLRLFPVLAQLHHAGLYMASLPPQQRLVLLESLRDLANDLRTQAPLQIKRATFCRRVLGFGKFEPVPGRFAPGEAVGLYCEVENLQDQELALGQYGLALEGRLELRNAWGKTLWQQEVHFEPDVAYSPRHDHFLFVRWRLPTQLRPGNYRVVFTLRELATQRTCSTELPMHIVTSASE
ncbi:hypothetical protein HRbin36_02704 [bacterium HR36]|nr:hypothetical protein HRbin36_02704 [bacterium HR36]